MAGSRRRQGRRRGQQAKPVDLWRPVPQLPDPKPIVPANDPGILLRSLGDPPLQGMGTLAERNLQLVAHRSAMLATALAATAGLLAEPEGGEPDS